MSTQVLNAQTYSDEHTRQITGGRASTKTMTYGGTIVRSLFLIIITLGFAAVGWNWAARVATSSGLWFFLGYMGLIALTFAAVNNPRIAAVAGLVYAVLMGTWMGSISRIYEAYYEGIVGQALLTTVCVFIACLLLYSLRVVRVTGKFVRILIISISGIALLYLFGWFVSIFGVRLNFLYNGSTTGIVISVAICIVAAMSLIADFAVVETGVNSGAPAAYEWYAAFGLQSTLVWLYLGDPVPAGSPAGERLIDPNLSGRCRRQLLPGARQRDEDDLELAGHRVQLRRAVRQVLGLRRLLELAAAVGQRLRAERGGVRLERVCRAADLGRVAARQPTARGGDQRRRVLGEALDQLGDERGVVADALGEAREHLAVDRVAPGRAPPGAACA